MDIQQVVKEVTVRGSFPGASDVARGYDQIASSAGNAAGAVDRQTKAQESADRALDKVRRQFQDGYREQQKFSEAQRTYERAVAQGLLTQQQAGAELASVRQKLDQLTSSQRLAANVQTELSSRAQQAAGSLGAVGSVLGTLHPALFAVAVVAGAAVAVINAMSNAAHELADKAQELRRFAEVTGLTTTQVQALRSEASKFGLTSEEAQTSIQAFTAKFEELRRGQGELLTQIRRVNPALADQMQMTENAADALTLFGRALTQVDNVFQRNALVKAATNRGGLSSANFLTGLNVGALTQQFSDAGKGLDETLIKKLAQLNVEIAKLQAQAKQALAEGFSEGQLEREKAFAKEWLDFARSARDFAVSGDLRFLLETVARVHIGGKGTVLGDLFGIDYSAGYKAPASAAPAATFAQRFQPALDNPLGALKLPGSSGAGGTKTLEAQVADLKTLIEVLGPAATETQKLELRQKELALAAHNAGTSAVDLSRAQRALNEEFRVNALRETVSTLGQAASRAQEYELKVGELQIKLNQGKISQDTFNRAIADFRQTQQIEVMRDSISALGGAATASEQYKLKLAELQQQFDRGKISQETFNRAALEANPVFQSLKSGAEGFATTLVDGLIDGKNFVDTLKSAFDGLAKSMANAAIKDLFSGNFEKAGIEAVVAIGAKLASNFFDNSQEKELQKAKDAWAQMTERLQEFNSTAQGFDLSGPASALRSLFDTAVELAKAANAAHDMAGLGQVVSSFVAGMSRIINEFAKPSIGLSESGDQIKRLKDQAAALTQTLADIGQSSAAASAAIQGGLLKQIAAIQAALADSLHADINEATGLGFVNSINALIVKQRQLIAENNVPAQLISDWFNTLVQKVVDDSDLTGDAFQNLIKLFPQLTGVVHESTAALDKQVQAERALKDENNQIARATLDYVNSLYSGPQSNLSPTAQLANAQTVYNSQLALAQGGNTEAQKTITQYADTFLKAAREVDASSAAYQAIFNQVTGQLLGLPVVQQADDPVVIALRDNLQAIHDVKASTDAVKSAVDLARTAINDALATGNLATISGALNAYLPAIDTNGDNALSFTEFLNGVAPLARDTTAASLLKNDQIAALGLASNTTVAQLLTAGQLLDQMGAFGLSKDTTVGSLLNQAQLSALGLSKDATVGAVSSAVNSLDTKNLTKIFNELDNNGDGLLEKSELIKNASGNTATNTANTKTAVDLVKSATDLVKQALDSVKSVSDAISGFAGRIVNAINNHGSMTQSAFVNLSDHLAHIRGGTDWAATHNAGSGGFIAAGAAQVAGSVGGWSYTAAAAGGVIPPYGLGLVSEHLNPTWVRAGAEPIVVSPHGIANDNSELRGLREELTAMRAELAALRRENREDAEGLAVASRVDAGTVASAAIAAGKEVAGAVRGAKQNQRRAG